MAQESIEETLERIVRRVTKNRDAVISGSTTFVDLKADSLDRVQILISLEDTFDIVLAEEEVSGIQTMAEFVSLIEAKIASKNANA
jgi:acyl carrier protein